MILFSDLHGRRDRLEAALAEAAGAPLACGGDILGSGDNQGCADLLRARQVPCCLGNHETDLLQLYSPGLSPDTLSWIRSWPLQLELEGAVLTHALIEQTSLGPHFQRVRQADQAEELMRLGPLVFIGHTHLPGWWEVPGRGPARWNPVYGEEELELRSGMGYVINLGSLGEPAGPGHPQYVQWTPGRVAWRQLRPRPVN